MKKLNWIILGIVIVALVIFFFPKSCGGGGGIGGPITSIDCKCIGIKGPPLFILFGGRIMDASPISCYGVCLKQTCKTETIWPGKNQTIVGGCAGVYYIYWQECCENWAKENGIVHIMCVGNWTVENNACKWECE